MSKKKRIKRKYSLISPNGPVAGSLEIGSIDDVNAGAAIASVNNFIKETMNEELVGIEIGGEIVGLTPVEVGEGEEKKGAYVATTAQNLVRAEKGEAQKIVNKYSDKIKNFLERGETGGLKNFLKKMEGITGDVRIGGKRKIVSPKHADELKKGLYKTIERYSKEGKGSNKPVIEFYTKKDGEIQRYGIKTEKEK